MSISVYLSTNAALSALGELKLTCKTCDKENLHSDEQLAENELKNWMTGNSVHPAGEYCKIMGVVNHRQHTNSSNNNDDEESINQKSAFLQQDMRHLYSKHSD